MSSHDILKTLYPHGFGYVTINDENMNIVHSPGYKYPNFKLIKYDRFELLINYDSRCCEVYVDNICNKYLIMEINYYGGNLAPVCFYGFTYHSINYFAIFDYTGGNGTPIRFSIITEVDNNFKMTETYDIDVVVDEEFIKHNHVEQKCNDDVSYYFQFEVIDDEIAANIFFIIDHKYLMRDCLKITIDEKGIIYHQFVACTNLDDVFIQNSYCEGLCVNKEHGYSKIHEVFKSCDLFNICTTNRFAGPRFANQRIIINKLVVSKIVIVMDLLVLDEIIDQEILSEYSFDVDKNILVTGCKIVDSEKILAILKLPTTDCKYVTVFATINQKTLRCKIEEL
jgi:hypothetical protein